MQFRTAHFLLASLFTPPATPAAPPTKPVSMLSPNTIASYSAQNATYADTADFNGDGKADLAIYTPATGSLNTYNLSIFLGNGDGTFQPPLNTVIVNQGAGFQIADFNLDGKLDVGILTAISSPAAPQLIGDYEVFLGRGDGTFQPPIHNQLPNLAGRSSPALFAADFNNDGKPDLMAPSLNGTGINFYAGNGDGTFGSPTNDAITPITYADFNSDGILDLLGVSGSPSALTVYLGTGNGTFGAGKAVQQAISYNNLGGLAFGDVNNDGKLDLIVSAAGSGFSFYVEPYVEVAVLLGNGDGTFQLARTFTGMQVGGVADLNQDGNLDLLSNDSFALGNGDGTFQNPVFLQIPIATCNFNTQGICKGSAFSFATDLNGDGLPDLILDFYWTPGPEVFNTFLSFINDSPGDGFLVPGALAPSGAVPVGLNSILTAYGVNLAPTTATATGPPYPTSLGGIELNVGGSLAQLIYVSPTQINYLMPEIPVANSYFPSTLPVTVQHVGQPLVPKGIAIPTMLDTPGLFTLNSFGLAAATAVRVAPDGTQTPVPVSSCIILGCTAVPIDTSGDPVYLSLYGTGMSFIPTEFEGGIGGHPEGVITYAGPQGVIPDLQQINIKLYPSSTPGTPVSIPISLTFTIVPGEFPFTISSNTVYVTIM